MSEPERIGTKNLFWTIVENNDFYMDILVPIAAGDNIVQATIDWLIETNTCDEMVLQDCYAGLEKHIVDKYDLPAELSSMAIALCESRA